MRVHLVHLPEEFTTADAAFGHPLGTREQVGARIAELLPGVVFDEGYGTFKRASYQLILTVTSAEPKYVDVLLDRPEGFTALKRVVEKTGWRVIDPAAQVFVDLDASIAARALVPQGAARPAAAARAPAAVHGPSLAPAPRAPVAPRPQPAVVAAAPEEEAIGPLETRTIVASWSLAAAVVGLASTLPAPVPAMAVVPLLTSVAQWLVLRRQIRWALQWAAATALQSLIYLGLVGLASERPGDPPDVSVALVCLVISSIPQAVILWDHARYRVAIWVASRPARSLITAAVSPLLLRGAFGAPTSPRMLALAGAIALAEGLIDSLAFVHTVAGGAPLRGAAGARSETVAAGAGADWLMRGLVAVAGVLALASVPVVIEGPTFWNRLSAFSSPQAPDTAAPAASTAASTPAQKTVDSVRDCVERYRLFHPERGFPANLGALGPDGEKCLSAEVASGQAVDYRFTYTPGVPNASGQVELYSICAVPATTQGSPRPTVVANQRFTSRTRAGNPRDQAGSASCAETYGDMVAAIEHCAATFAADHSGAGYPPALGDLRSCLSTRNASDFKTYSVAMGDYRYTYIAGAPDDRGVIGRFEIYGVSGKGNAEQVFADQAGAIRITRASRLAVAQDPTVEEDLKTAEQAVARNRLSTQDLGRSCDGGDQTACNGLAARLLETVRKNLPRHDQADLDKAVRLYSAACDARVTSACATLGEYYSDDVVVPFDLSQAAPRLDSACSLGHALSCHNLATLLRNIFRQTAEEATANRQRAMQLDERGCRLNDGASCVTLAMLLAEGSNKAARARVPTLLETSCRLGDADGCYRLAAIRNNDQRLLLKACARGDFPDCARLNSPAGASAAAAER